MITKQQYYCPSCFWCGTDPEEKDFPGFWETATTGLACPKCYTEVEPDDSLIERDGER